MSNIRGQVSRFGPNPERNFYMLDEKLLWAPIDPLPKLLLMDFFHRERKGQDVPSQRELAKLYNVGLSTIARAFDAMERDGYLLSHLLKGKRQIYVAAFPAIPDGHRDRPAFQKALAAAINRAIGCPQKGCVQNEHTQNDDSGVFNLNTQTVHSEHTQAGDSLVHEKTQEQGKEASEPASPSPEAPALDEEGALSEMPPPPQPETETQRIKRVTSEIRQRAQTLWGLENMAEHVDHGLEGKGFKRAATRGFSAAQFEACYRYLRRYDPHWNKRHLHAMEVSSRLPPWLSEHSHDWQTYLTLPLPLENAHGPIATPAPETGRPSPGHPSSTRAESQKLIEEWSNDTPHLYQLPGSQSGGTPAG